MAAKDTKRDLLFLLGAGASKDAGMPLATEITDRITTDIDRNYPCLLPLMRFVHGGICFGRGCAGKVPSLPVNIEEFLMACQDLARRGSSSLYPFVASWHERLADLGKLPAEIADSNAGNSFDFVSGYCKQRLREWLTIGDPSSVKYFRSLKDFLAGGYRLHLFTLNYDECVEQALNDALGEINGKWTTGFDHKGWKPDLFENKRHKFEALLYKLHGSLDWVEDEELGVCSVKWPMAERAEEVPSTYDSLLIFATAMKVIPRDPYLTLLTKFRSELYRCECVVILGYSFGDDHVNTMLLDALRRRPQLQCVIANRKGSITDYLPSQLKEEIANERFHNIYQGANGEVLGVQLALEKNVLLNKVKEACETQPEGVPFQ
ncbi:MAG: SIR2 family protein [Planctomycetes bacterium]|nr:SIR2 family protein [Planctomycetota bacterium]